MEGVSKAEAIRIIKVSKGVFVWVRAMPEDGWYFKISKAEALLQINDAPFEGDLLVVLREDGFAYIN